MRKILVLSNHPLFIKQVAGQINAETIECTTIEEAEVLVRLDLQACIVDGTEQAWVEVVWQVERLARRTKLPIIVVGSFNASDEAGLYKAGCSRIIAAPLQAETLNLVLATQPKDPSLTKNTQVSKTPLPMTYKPNHNITFKAISDAIQSNNQSELAKSVAQTIKQTFKLNRIAIYIKQSNEFAPIGSAGFNTQQLVVIPQTVALLIELTERQCIIDLATEEAWAAGWSYAIPMAESGQLLGFALVGEPITGQGWCSILLSQVFNACNSLASAFTAIKAKEQITQNLKLLQDALKQASPVFILLNDQLQVIEHSKTAQRHFGGKDERTGKLTFERIPRCIGSKMYQVLKTKAALESFAYTSESGVNYQVNITPVSDGDAVMLFAMEGKLSSQTSGE